MKSVEEQFTETQTKYPLWSSYLCFAVVIKYKGRKFPVTKHFNKLVDKNDYDKEEKYQIIEFLKNEVLGRRLNKGLNDPPK